MVPAYRRTLLKAVLAGVLLCGLWFVPSANAAPEAETAARSGPEQTRPAPAFNPTPYLVGTGGFLAAGAALFADAVRRSHSPTRVRPAVR